MAGYSRERFIADVGDWATKASRTREELAGIRQGALKHFLDKDVVFTCDDCPAAPDCSLAFDQYNTCGDCLMEK